MTRMQQRALGVFAIAAIAGATQADVYVDAQQDLFDNSFAHLDIAQVTITNDATNLYIEMQARGSIASPDWGKYMWYFDTKAGGTTTNAWNRPVTLTNEIDFYVGSWVDGGGAAQYWGFDGTNWNLDSTNPVDLSSAGAGIVKYTIPLAFMGLNVGDVLKFDVASSGGGDGDPGVDHLSVSGLATPGWGTPSRAGDFLTYTVVPTPGAMGVVVAAGLFAGRRRR
jgi:hypothetical protein